MSLGRPRLTAHSLIYLAANSAAAAVPLLLLPILTRHLSTDDYGRVAMFQMLVGAVSALAGLSVHAAAARRFYDKGLDAREMAQFVGACLTLLVITCAAMLALVWVAQDGLQTLTGLPPLFIATSVLCSATGFASNLVLAQWQVRLQPIAYGSFQVAGAVAVAAVTTMLVVGAGWGAAGPIAGQAVGSSLMAVFALAWLGQARLLDFTWRPDLMKDALAFGVPLVPHIVGLFLLGTIDRAVIGHQLGLQEVGIYVVAAQLALGLKIVFDAFNKSWVPWLYARLQRGDPGELATVVRITWAYFLIALAIAALAFPLGSTAIRWLAGPAYERSGPLVGWLALSQAFYGMYLMVTNYLFYAGRTALLSTVTVSCGVACILLLLLGSRYGLGGVAIALATASCLRFLLTWAAAQHSVAMPWFSPLRHARP